MKKHSTILYSALALLALGSCSDDAGEEQQLPLEPQELTDFRVVAPAFKYDQPSSRLNVDLSASGFDITWLENDTVGVMPSEGAQAPFPLRAPGGNPSATATFTGGGWALRPSASYSAYYPYIGDINLEKHNIPVNYLGQWQKTNSDYNYLSPYIYMAANAVTPEQGVATFNLCHVGCYTVFEILTAEPTELGSITFKAEQPLFVHKGKLDMANPNIELQPTVMSDSISFCLEGVKTTAENLKATLCFMFAPSHLLNQKIKAIVRDIDGYEEEVNFVGKEFVAGHAYKFADLRYVEFTKHAQPGWTYDETSNPYQSGMTSVVCVPRCMQKFVGEGDEMSAYMNGELRGTGELINGKFYLMVHGNIGEVGKVSFKYYNKKKQYIYEANNVVDYNSDKVFGVADKPEELPLHLVK